ncbi:hypothetical protein RHOFW104T7_03045 [Rhodanobacter thiooxydans]|uniref:DUF4139 domain-containing protein n=1 Tax=Rhodanobacter thiooxydans TaxID=416169 RepID=A0A154QED8_9GAMM|nr:DUF4139 domain-containing protein [Rhodanobacter thiooxydans]EIL96645.1 hypothetical protein UUA_17410 [Rhodanobacter thiooxydans LCS2]KZC21969.1 hypothetical protein RHOFW104T7_03045 [Rhodanobacter thiooxydans]MCW0203120.1 DUF4139 domain-containing protein [Rhodanobacter thiooxydans]
MTTAHRSALALTCIIALGGAWPTYAADTTTLTLYRSDSPALYASHGGGDVDDGYAVVREQRSLSLAAGTHDVVIGDLPNALDAEALALGFPDGNAKVISQRLLLAQGADAALSGLIGHAVDVLGAGGLPLASGTLLRAGNGLLIRSANGTTLVRNYAAVHSAEGGFPIGSSLSLRVDAARAGQARAVLSYPTSGLGWRAAYVATLKPGATCRMQFESRASIANRSGRDWHDAQLTLIAGEPNMAKTSGPQPMMAMARGLNAKAEALPQQDSLGDYRSYALPGAVELPDGSVSQVPLYADRTLDCERTALYENGNSYQPPQPILNRDFNPGGGSAIVSTLKLKAFDSLPAGYLRVLTADRHGTPQFIGEGRIEDTPKGSDATITLGTAFDLRATRERTAFHVDKAGRTLDEAFRIALTNAGDSVRTVTVREHPGRWRQWTLVSSSSKPSAQTPDTLEFRIDVPASGKAVLDYAVRYQWTADEQPQ